MVPACRSESGLESRVLLAKKRARMARPTRTSIKCLAPGSQFVWLSQNFFRLAGRVLPAPGQNLVAPCVDVFLICSSAARIAVTLSGFVAARFLVSPGSSLRS